MEQLFLTRTRLICDVQGSLDIIGSYNLLPVCSGLTFIDFTKHDEMIFVVQRTTAAFILLIFGIQGASLSRGAAVRLHARSEILLVCL